jgi:uncharacterized membrane protein HdeD (DUF308 family)
MNEVTHAVKSGGNKMTILGVLAIVLGILCLLAPGMTGISVLSLIGFLVLAAGIVRMLWAFAAGSLGRGVLMFAVGGLTVLCGAALIAHPMFASGVLTLLLAVYFLADGIAEVMAGIRLRPLPGAGWLTFGGIVSVLLGLMIWRQFPLSGVFAIGILLGIKLFLVGLIMITGGSVARSAAKSMGG